MTALVRNVRLFLFALCIVTTAAHGASQTIPVGGTGGGRFSIRCPERQVLVGFSMHERGDQDLAQTVTRAGALVLTQLFLRRSRLRRWECMA